MAPFTRYSPLPQKLKAQQLRSSPTLNSPTLPPAKSAQTPAERLLSSWLVGLFAPTHVSWWEGFPCSETSCRQLAFCFDRAWKSEKEEVAVKPGYLGHTGRAYQAPSNYLQKGVAGEIWPHPEGEKPRTPQNSFLGFFKSATHTK